LRSLIERRRAELQQKGLALAQGLYAAKPGAFTARLGKCWRAWHGS
jgi:hypothetical protein